VHRTRPTAKRSDIRRVESKVGANVEEYVAHAQYTIEKVDYWPLILYLSCDRAKKVVHETVPADLPVCATTHFATGCKCHNPLEVDSLSLHYPAAEVPRKALYGPARWKPVTDTDEQSLCSAT
jgi:hypothetical protein